MEEQLKRWKAQKEHLTVYHVEGKLDECYLLEYDNLGITVKTPDSTYGNISLPWNNVIIIVPKTFNDVTVENCLMRWKNENKRVIVTYGSSFFSKTYEGYIVDFNNHEIALSSHHSATLKDHIEIHPLNSIIDIEPA